MVNALILQHKQAVRVLAENGIVKCPDVDVLESEIIELGNGNEPNIEGSTLQIALFQSYHLNLSFPVVQVCSVHIIGVHLIKYGRNMYRLYIWTALATVVPQRVEPHFIC